MSSRSSLIISCLPFGIGQLEQRVHGRIEMTGEHFDNHLTARTAIEPKHVPIARLIDPPVDNDRRLEQRSAAPDRCSVPVRAVRADESTANITWFDLNLRFSTEIG